MTRYRKLFPNEKLGTGMEEKGSMMNRTIKAAVGMVAIAAMSVGTLAACGGFAGVDLPDRAGDHQLFQAEGVYFS